MSAKISSLSIFLLSLIIVVSLVIQFPIAAPYSASADPGIMKWDTVTTPGGYDGSNMGKSGRLDIVNSHTPIGSDTPRGSEVISMLASNSGTTVSTVMRYWDVTGYSRSTATSSNMGINWRVGSNDPEVDETNAYKVYESEARASMRLVTTGVLTGPKVITGKRFDGAGLDTNETIRFADYSQPYLDKRRDLAFVTVGGANGGRLAIRSSNTWSSWNVQLNPNGTAANQLGTATNSGIDYLAVKFSPNYASDSSVAVVFADATATYFNIGYVDTNTNTILQYAFPAPGIEIKNATSPNGASPNWDQLNTVDLHLPSDFSGQSSSLRRAYVSLDAYGSGGIDPVTLKPFAKLADAQDGIYRIDDTTTYVLMDTSSMADKSIYSIAYYGTYASGKLLAGERTGFPCTATVPTWFTDSPTTCPIPCWYPALKPPTGAANQGTCSLSAKNGIGSAIVDWNANGTLAYAATSSLVDIVYDDQPGLDHGAPVASVADKAKWYQMYNWDAVPNDESALSISRNNGETWNQLSMIDTTVDWFNDVAVAPDCTTVYLASANRNLGIAGMCNEFDSVWRASINPNVTSPLPALPPLGTYWERVFTHTTSGSCTIDQSDLPILRVVPSCTDKKDGEIVAWAAQNALANISGKGGVMAWSPDFGDYWATITPRHAIQDFAFESSTILYTVNSDGAVQRLPFTGTSWSTNLPTYDTTLLGGHTIVAVPDGKVLVGASTIQSYQAAYSADKGVTFSIITDSLYNNGNEHVIFDVDFKNNNFMYMGDDNPTSSINPGTVYRNTLPSFSRWTDNDMMSPANGGAYIFAGVPELAWPATFDPPHPVGQFGIAQAWTGDPQPALYAAHDNVTYSDGTSWGSAVCRTLQPRDGMPKPGILWDCLDVFTPLKTTGVQFTLEPTSLKYCGCCTLDTNTTLYAIDDERGAVRGTVTPLDGRWNNHLNNTAVPWDPAFPGYTPSIKQGMLWAFTDCLAKKGPLLKAPAEQFLVGADPVTGRNQQVDLSWEQLCLSTWYQLQIAKDAAFTMRINPSVNFGGVGGFGVIKAVTGSILLKMDETNMTSPAAWLAPGQLPEAGAIYYWRIRSAKSATRQIAASPWSEPRSFTVKAGFIINTPYYGVQLLAPNNACTGCKVKPAFFSWSPWKEATKYQFDLATDPEFKSPVVTTTTTTTGYEYSGTLNYSTNYFWRVKVLEVNGQNIPSDWSATFSLQTEPAPAPPTPPPAEPPIPVWVWVLIVIGAILVIVTLILIFKSRRRY